MAGLLPHHPRPRPAHEPPCFLHPLLLSCASYIYIGSFFWLPSWQVFYRIITGRGQPMNRLLSKLDNMPLLLLWGSKVSPGPLAGQGGP